MDSGSAQRRAERSDGMKHRTKAVIAAAFAAVLLALPGSAAARSYGAGDVSGGLANATVSWDE
jgi:hypothetical protein